MNLYNVFEDIELPASYKTGGYSAFLDPIRKRLIKITPEEVIRQKTIVYLNKNLGIPINYIGVEESLSHYCEKQNGRVDILFFYMLNDQMVPLGLVECKSSGVGLSAQALEQATYYADVLNINYVFLCDGINLECYYYHEKNEAYIPLNSIPHFKEMIQKKVSFIKKEPYQYIRTPLNKLSYPDLIDKNLIEDFIGEDTHESIIGNIINLAECFEDTSHLLCPEKINKNGFMILKDLGLSWRRYNDSSDGGFGTGWYRLFLTTDLNQNTGIYGIAFLKTAKLHGDVKYGNQSGKSVLVVSYTDDDSDKMIFQINLNKFLRSETRRFKITHNGAFSTKNARIEKLKGLIMNEDEELLVNNEIYLGSLPSDKLLYANDEYVHNFIRHLLRYARIVLLYKRNLQYDYK